MVAEVTVDSNVPTDAYSYCMTTLGDSASDRELFACVASGITVDSGSRNYARTVFVVYSGAMVFFMQAGFAMLCAGCVRKKNVQNT
jgi:Ammonium Transporter Family